jgi:Holliday junction resolvase-like predicted endonuclease
MTTFDTGRKAEAVATEYLQNLGYHILAQNWRLRSCEIDIVVRKDGVAYCVEVKYRQNDQQGDGLEYVTPTKLKQMQFAAEQWVHATKWSGEYQLAAIQVAGDDYEITDFIDDIIL